MGKIGLGTYGAVVELVHSTLRTKLAGKIVLQEKTTESEVLLWSELQHENILSLNDVFRVSHAGTLVFFMDKQRASLETLIGHESFGKDQNGLEQAKIWLLEVCNGVKYLHQKKLAHLDIKLGNVLISNENVAKLSDFGSLIKTEQAADRLV